MFIINKSFQPFNLVHESL